MKYWYLKNGDVVGPWSAEEIKKDESFADDCLVCPEDKAEQAEFWKAPQNYAEDFFPVVEEKKEEAKPNLQEPQDNQSEEEKEIPAEISLDDIDINEDETPKDSAVLPPSPVEEPAAKENKEEEKNPFESDRPQIAPNIEDTISSHVIAPRLDADGDTLLEDIPAKAILSSDEEDKNSADTAQPDFAAPSSLSVEDTLDDTPILNIFERTDKEVNKTREIGDISENIYDTYGSDAKIAPQRQEESSRREISSDNISDKEEIHKKNNKIYLLVLLMVIVVIVALLLALLGSNEEQQMQQQPKQQAALPTQTKASPLQEVEEDEMIDTPTTDASAFFASKNDNAEQDRAVAKVKKFVLPNSKSLEEYLNTKYAGYQTSWVADVLSGRNYYVHFYASKIRQEPIVYSFSIDLDKNEINGLNNLGMDLLVKGE